jgi:solute carrier family 25 carnitine/acylcarnitine transporter 20/29
MSADFWGGYISGAAGIILGNPLDVLKVRLQAGRPTSAPLPPTSPPSPSAVSSYIRPFLLGTAAPVLGYGALNALLFVSYNRTEAFLNSLGTDISSPAWSGDQGRGTNLLTTWLAGAVGGLATWVVSTPTELVKCRAQVQQQQHQQQHALPTASSRPTPSTSPSSSSWSIAKQVIRTSGLRGLYAGGTVTVLRDSIGYGFYFWGYELFSRSLHQLQFPPPSSSSSSSNPGSDGNATAEAAAARVLLCGGLAGVLSWASIFPLDVVKTRVQTQESFLFDDGERGGRRRGGVSGEGRALGRWPRRRTGRAGRVPSLEA